MADHRYSSHVATTTRREHIRVTAVAVARVASLQAASAECMYTRVYESYCLLYSLPTVLSSVRFRSATLIVMRRVIVLSYRRPFCCCVFSIHKTTQQICMNYDLNNVCLADSTDSFVLYIQRTARASCRDEAALSA